MKQQTRLLTAVLATTLLFTPIAEAKRAGGGKSHGMKRQASSIPAKQNTPAQPAQPTQQPVQKNGSNVGKMVAAGAAGAAVGALATNALADDGVTDTEQNNGGTNWLMWIVIAGLAFALFRFFNRPKTVAVGSTSGGNSSPFGKSPSGITPTKPTAFSNTNVQNNTQNGVRTNVFGQPIGSSNSPFGSQNTASYDSNQVLPDGSDNASFVRMARQRFNHIQAINSANNINEIRRYLTNDLYQSIYQDVMANTDTDVAEFTNLNANIVDATTENAQYVVTVAFSGMVSEDMHSAPQPFSELWHFVKPVSGGEWLVAGIEQH